MASTRRAVRHALTIEHVLRAVARYDQRRVKPELRAILLSAGFQIIWMDRIPEFAAVDQAVELARQHAGRRASGMVNAVLRSLTRAVSQRRTVWQRLNSQHVRVSWDQACAFESKVLPAPDSDQGRIARYHPDH